MSLDPANQTVPDRRWKSHYGRPSDFPSRVRMWLVACVGLLGSIIYVDVEWISPASLVVEIQSNSTSTAQLFYDTGNGFNEAESAQAPVPASTSYGMVRFALPERTIYKLRLDPLGGSGAFAIRRIYLTDPYGGIVRQFVAKDLISIQQLPARSDSALEASFNTGPGADDPILEIALPNPVSPLRADSARIAFLVTAGLVVLLLVASSAAGVPSIVQPYGRLLTRPLDRVAAAISDPIFLEFNRTAVAFYLILVIAFAACVIMGLHGSSMALFSGMGPADRAVQPIAGWPKPIRADEWAYHTPAILHQVFRATPFAVERSALGPDGTALISNIPVWHLTTLFRPQFWGFLVLPTASAFSFYWQFKALLLLSGVFSLLLLMTRSSPLALLGTLWYASAPWVQWAYSWPSLLPEMVGLFCLVMCTTFYLTVGRRRGLLIAAACICAACAINFALCAYIPHLIPLVWLGVFLCGWWGLVRWRDIVAPEGRRWRLAALCGAWFIVGVVMLLFYQDARNALTTIGNTSYPGRRSLPSGAYPAALLFSHFFSFWSDDVRIPGMYGNVCEWSGFIWLAPFTILLARGLRGDVYTRGVYWTLLVAGTLLVAWMTLPVPQAIGHLLFLDKTGSQRSQHALGLVNVGVLMVFLALRAKSRVLDRGLGARALLAAGIFVVVFPVLKLANEAAANFVTTGQVGLAALYVTLALMAIIENRLRLLAVVLLVPQFVLFGLVNPVARGLRVFESSPLFRFVQNRPHLLRDRWIVYSRSFPHPGFFQAVGCEVVTGLAYVPDLDSLSVFDPTGAQHAIFNRSVYFLADPKYDAGPAKFEQPNFQVVLWTVSPLDPGLRRIGVRYAAFVERPPPEIAARMKSLNPTQISGFWLYELPDPGSVPPR